MALKDRRSSSFVGATPIQIQESRRIFWDLFGECRLIRDWLDEKSEWSLWLLLKVFDAVLRGFSQVVFANNTVSGLFVVIGLAVADLNVCLAGLLGASLATLTGVVFNQPWPTISNGLVTYNGVLVGTVTASLCPPIVQATNGPEYLSWCLIALGGIMSALVTSGMANLCRGPSLPAMTVPFNLIDLLIFISLPSALQMLAQPNSSAVDMSLKTEQNETEAVVGNVTELTVDWLMVLRGSFVSMGQVYAVESIACSVIMYVGVVMFSPLLALALFGGSLLASICGLGLTNNYSAIYSGLWGYNSALTAGAIAATFFVPTLLSAFTAGLAVVFTAAAQRAFGLVLAPASLPVLTIPFVVTSSIFLAVSSGAGSERLVKAPDGRPPEYQRRRHSNKSTTSDNVDV